MDNLDVYEKLTERVFPPGETLREELEKTGFTQRELAVRTGRPFKTISEIMNGKTRVTPDTAIQLENVLGVSAGFWLEEERKYREFQARKEEEIALKNQVGQLDACPLTALKQRGFVSGIEQSTALVKEVIGFYGVNALSQIEEIYFDNNVHYRVALEQAGNLFHLAAWVRQGELQANRIQAAPYNEELFRKSLEKIRNPSGFESEISIQDIHELFRSTGVVLVYVPQYRGCRISTLVRWLRPDKALIQFGIPFTSEPDFCMSLFHGAVHILRHSKKKIYFDDFGDVIEKNDMDQEADTIARNFLIQDEEYQFIKEDEPYTRKKIHSHAFRFGLSPGIIVSRLQNDGMIPKHWMNYLKKRLVDWDRLSDHM